MGFRRGCCVDRVVFAVLLLGYTALLFALFYRQATAPAVHVSDITPYVLEMQGKDSGFLYPYPILFKLGAFFHRFLASPEVSLVVALTLLCALAAVILRYCLGTLLVGAGAPLPARIGVTLLTFGLLFVSMLYAPGLTARFGIFPSDIPIYDGYLGVGSPNPFHNATYLAARPFAIAAFFLFAKILPRYETTDLTALRKSPWDYLWFALFLFLATMAKPSFTLVMVSVCGLVMLWRLAAGRFRHFWPTVWLGLCFVPTFAALIWQYLATFTATAEGGIGFALGIVWAYYCSNLPLALVLAMFFPLVVLALNFGALKQDALYRFSWQFWAVSCAEWFFLYEKGDRIWHANFNWGYLYGLLFAFLGSAVLLVKRSRGPGRAPLWQLVLQWGAFGLHLISGIWYLAVIF